jgi:transposase-like protein
MDELQAEMSKLAQELDACYWKCHVEGGNSVRDICEVWDVVPQAVYPRLQRYRELNGDERDHQLNAVSPGTSTTPEE